jgi:hypothetical protein
LRCNAKNNVSWRIAEKVRPAYERLVSDGAWIELPSWQELQNLVEDPRADLQRLNHPVWGGWLHRLFRSFLWLETGKIDRQFAWLARQYGDQVPVELGFSPKEMEMTRKIQRVASGEDRFIKIAIWSTLLLFLAAIVGGVAIRSDRQWIAGSTVTLGLLSAIFYLTLMIAVTAKMIAAWGAARRHFAMIIEPAGGQASGDLAARLPCQLRVQMTDPKRRVSAAEPYPTKEHVM